MTSVEQRQIQLAEAESSQRQHFDCLSHYETMSSVNEIAEYTKFNLLKPRLFQDGNQWCVLFGENLQSGIAGFGNTPHLAILDWNKAWHKSLIK